MRSPEFWSEAPGPLGGLVAGLLAPVAAAVDVAGRLRRAVVRPYRAPAPVICVGNLVAGGSGKTPVVLSLAAILARRGIAAHIVTRGYGGRLAGPVRVDPAIHDAEAVGDEALLAAGRAPARRARGRRRRRAGDPPRRRLPEPACREESVAGRRRCRLWLR
jgi:tetraacyldisaccharide 4'-kinase